MDINNYPKYNTYNVWDGPLGRNPYILVHDDKTTLLRTQDRTDVERLRREGYDYHATVAVRDKETGLQQEYYQRNAFDIGFTQYLKGIDSVSAYLDEDEWLDLHVTVKETWEPDTGSIEQKGVLQDEEGII